MVLPADESVGFLLAIEIIERTLELKHAFAVFAEHQHEAAVPKEDVAVECGVNVRRNKTVLLGRLAEI